MKRLIILCLAFLTLISCMPQDTPLKIGYLQGMAYAPVKIMEANNSLERFLPGRSIHYVTYDLADDLIKDMQSGKLDIGFAGVTPVLEHYDKGYHLGIFTGLGEVPVTLMSKDPEIRSIRDLFGRSIALPQLTSVNNILLMMAADQVYRNPKIFESQVIEMPHVKAIRSLKDGSVDVYFASSPFIRMALLDGAHEIFRGEDAFGGKFTFAVGFVSPEYTGNPDVVKALRSALVESMKYMESDSQEVIRFFAKEYGLTQEQLSESYKTLTFNTRITGVPKFIDFMKTTGILKSNMKPEDIILSNAAPK